MIKGLGMGVRGWGWVAMMDKSNIVIICKNVFNKHCLELLNIT